MIYMKYPEDTNSEAESRLVVAKSCRQGEMGNNCLINTGFPFAMMKMFWNEIVLRVAEHCECM